MIETNDENVNTVLRTLYHVPMSTFELRSNEEIVDTIACEIKNGIYTATSSTGGCWKLSLTGFLIPKITATDPETGNTVATFKTLWDSEGVVVLGNGHKFFWMRNSLIHGEPWQIIGDDHWPVMTFHIDQSHVARPKYGVYADAEISASKMPEISLLAALGYYLIMLTKDDY